jgi:hypothetical protein
MTQSEIEEQKPSVGKENRTGQQCQGAEEKMNSSRINRRSTELTDGAGEVFDQDQRGQIRNNTGGDDGDKENTETGGKLNNSDASRIPNSAGQNKTDGSQTVIGPVGNTNSNAPNSNSSHTAKQQNSTHFQMQSGIQNATLQPRSATARPLMGAAGTASRSPRGITRTGTFRSRSPPLELSRGGGSKGNSKYLLVINRQSYLEGGGSTDKFSLNVFEKKIMRIFFPPPAMTPSILQARLGTTTNNFRFHGLR